MTFPWTGFLYCKSNLHRLVTHLTDELLKIFFRYLVPLVVPLLDGMEVVSGC